MARRLRNIIIVLTIALAPRIATASAAATSVTACNNPAASALNQYCEIVPTATGAKTPRPGTPVLATALPAGVLRQISAPSGLGGSRAASTQASARRLLLNLPAPGKHEPLSTVGAATASVWSLSPWIILILVAMAVGLTATAARRWRRARSDGG